jgi:hypothetical protein
MRALKKQSHRKPPRPATWDSPRGACRFCGLDIIDDGKINRRKNWHAGCVHIWKICNDPKYAREFVYLRDEGKCASCGVKTKLRWYQDAEANFELDHIKPLKEACGDISFWMEDNLQILCNHPVGESCHKKKTSAEATQRAVTRRALTKK